MNDTGNTSTSTFNYPTYSISFFIKVTPSTTSYTSYVFKQQNALRTTAIYVRDSSFIGFYNSILDNGIQVPFFNYYNIPVANMSNGQWHHIVCMASTQKPPEMYIDNVAISKALQVSPSKYPNQGLTHDGQASFGKNSIFTIKGLKITNRYLTATEINSEYNIKDI
jgi:hypothetical protein